jgi:hypothetical protein
MDPILYWNEVADIFGGGWWDGLKTTPVMP